MNTRALIMLTVGLLLIISPAQGATEKVWWEQVSSAGIPGHNILIVDNISRIDAKRKCLRDGFKSFDYEQRKRRAYFQDVNMDDVELKTDYKDNPYDHYTPRRLGDIGENRPSPTVAAIGTVKALKGDVWYAFSRDGLEKNPRRLKSGDGFGMGYFIKTAKGGRAFLEFGTGFAKTNIGSNSVFDVRKYTERVVKKPKGTKKSYYFNLIKGYVRTWAGALFEDGDGVYVATKNSVAGCRGTDFVVHYDEATNTDLVLVKNGVVDVTGQRDGKVVVHAGEQVRVTAGTPGRVTKMDEALWRRYKR